MAPLRRLRPRRPRTLRGWLLTAGISGLVLLGGGFAALYLLVFETSSPAPFTLSTSSDSSSSSDASSSSIAVSQIPGTWNIASGSMAGYRVREQLAFLSAPSDAVGRTSSITGAVTLTDAGSTITVSAASFKVDVSTLRSDRSMRDNRIRSIGLQSDQFPTATFTLSSAVSMPEGATTGQTVHLSVTGDLTIHGTTKTETIPLDARLSGAQIEIVGSITFPWGDFGMEAPSVGGFVSVTDTATMEFDLHLQHA